MTSATVPIRARVYVDGLNLYYGMLRGHQGRKWLDLEQWAQRLLPQYTVDRVVYCTARVSALPHDPHAHVRQDQYLKALATIPTVTIVEGKFSIKPRRGQRLSEQGCNCCTGEGVPCACCMQPTAQILKPEEKGSDVNVAVNLVKDALLDAFDLALVVSNDSDLQGAVDIARLEGGKQVFIASRVPKARASLRGDEHRQLRAAAIEACQLPVDIVTATGGQVRKPQTW